MSLADPAHVPARGPLAWLRRHPLTTFYVLAFLIAVAFVPLVLLTDWEARAAAAIELHGLEPTTSYLFAAELLRADPSTLPFVLVAVLQPLSPDVAAFVVAGLCFGGPGVVALLQRYRFWAGHVGWRAGLPVWGVCIALTVAVSLATAGLNALLLPEGSFRWAPDLSLGGFLFALAAAMALDGGGVAEETGWRGFALPLFQSLHSPVRASVLLGLIWAIWHWPLKIDLLVVEGWGYFVTYNLLFTARMILLSLVIAFFTNGVGGSTLIAIAMHGLHNDSGGLMGRLSEDSFAVMVRSELALSLPLAVAAAALILLSLGRLNIERVRPDVLLHPASPLAWAPGHLPAHA